MKLKWGRLYLGLLTFVIFSGCGGSGSDEAELESFESVTSLFTYTQAAFSSLGSADLVANIEGDESSERPLIFAQQSSEDPLCTVNGDPYDADSPSDDKIKASDADGYGEQKIHCATTFNSGSSGTVIGSFSIIQGVICALEENGGLTFETNPSTETRSITFSSNCFDDNFDQLGETISVDVTAYAFEPGDFWTQRLRVRNDQVIGTRDIFILNTPERIAFSMVPDIGDSTPDSYEMFNVSFDRQNGILRYDNYSISEQSGNESDEVHSRFFIDGDFDEVNQAFTQIDYLKGVIAEVETTDDLNGGEPRYRVTTVDGDNGSGYQYFTYYTSPEAGNNEECTEGKTCAQIDSITFDPSVPGDLEFVSRETINPNDYAAFPACFDDVSKARLFTEDCELPNVAGHTEDLIFPLPTDQRSSNRLGAFCRDAGSSASIDSSWKLDFSSLPNSAGQAMASADKVLKVTYGVRPGVGPVFYSDFDVTVVVKVDGNTLDSSRFQTSSNHLSPPALKVVDVPSGSFSADSEVSIEMTGTHSIECESNRTSPLDSGSVAVGISQNYIRSFVPN